MAKRKSAMSVNVGDIRNALRNVRKYINPTPLLHSITLSELSGREVYLKWENKLRTGSFKERGAINALTLLDPKKKKIGVCAASAGNHALALSFYANKMKVPCHVVMPIHAPLVKINEARKQKANVILEGTTFDDAVTYGRKLAKDKGYTYIHAFDNTDIVAGQGTAGLELLDQFSSIDTLICPVGGGGLLSGIGIAIKDRKPNVHIIGVQSDWVVEARKKQHSDAFIRPVSIADGIAIKTPGVITQPLLESVVNKMISASEAEIARGIITLLEGEKTVVEGAGAAGLAAIFQNALPKKSKKVCIIICGSNIDTYTLARLIARDQGERGRLLRMIVSVPDRPGSLSKVTNLIASAQGNVLDVMHDRAHCSIPGNVSITFLLEVRDNAHKKSVLKTIRDHGLGVTETE